MLGYFTILTNLILASYCTAPLSARASPMVEKSLFPPLGIPISFVTLSNRRGNLEALFSPRAKVGARKFGELARLKL